MGQAHFYHHMTDWEREFLLDEIRAIRLRGDCVTITSLAAALGRSRKSIRNELARGKVSGMSVDELIHSYNPVTAGKHARAARTFSVKRGKKSENLLSLIRQGITEKRHSPDQLVHRTLAEAGYCVAVSTIYTWLARKGPLKDCRKKLRYRGKRKKNGDLRLVGRFAGVKNLEQRPAGCTERSEFGHIEADTIVSAKKAGAKACLFTFVDRKTRHVFAYRADSCTACCFGKALDWLEKKYPAGAIRSITADRGSEFSDWAREEKIHGYPIYFCRPHHPWEKGTNENTNGLIREIFPKGTDFSKIGQREVNSQCLKLLHSRPRKCLGYRTTAEKFKEECFKFLNG